MQTAALVHLMAQDARLGLRLPQRLGLALAAGAIAAAALFVLAVGPREDVATALRSWRFVAKFVVTGALAFGALGWVLRLAVPMPVPGRGGAWMAPALLAVLVAAELALQPVADWGRLAVGSNAMMCLTVIPALALAPLAALLVALRHGAPARPGWAGAGAGLAAAAIAATLYAANCTDDSPLFVALWYPLATAIVTLTGGLIGRRWLRW